MATTMADVHRKAMLEQARTKHERVLLFHKLLEFNDCYG